MNRPEVRIISPQTEESRPANISKSEEEALLAKYGYGSTPNSYSTYQEPTKNDPNSGLTFEEMVKRDEEKRKEEILRRNHLQRGPKPITFEGDYTSETRYGSDDGFSFKVNVVTNIK